MKKYNVDNTTLKKFKENAKQLALEHNLKHNKALHLLSEMYGFKNYQTIKPHLKQKFQYSLMVHDEFRDINKKHIMFTFDLNMGEFSTKEDAKNFHDENFKIRLVLEEYLDLFMIIVYNDDDETTFVFNDGDFVFKTLKEECYKDISFSDDSYEVSNLKIKDLFPHFTSGSLLQSIAYGYVEI